MRRLTLNILREHLHDLQMGEITFHLNPYGQGWQEGRIHILGLMGFEKEEIDTSKKVIELIERYEYEGDKNEKDTESIQRILDKRRNRRYSNISG